MKKLDWYIVGKFLSTFFFTVIIFSMVTLIIDFSEKVERFIETENITKSIIAFEYFPTFLLFILGFLWPMLTLISVVFFTSRLANNSEILSMLNAGMSFRRLLRPYWVASGFLFILYLVGVHYIIPKANAHRGMIDRVYFSRNRDQGKTSNVHFFVAPGTKVFMTHYSKRDSTARNFRIERIEDSELVSLTKASRAKYVDGAWRLDNYEIRHFDGLEETIEVGGPRTLDTVINLQPADFVEYQEEQSGLTTPQLIDRIRRQRDRGANSRKYEVELARRSAEPFTIFILTLIGVSVAGRKVRGGVGIQLALGIFIGALFVFISRFASTISAASDLPVYLGMWMPNLIFAAAAIWLATRAQR